MTSFELHLFQHCRVKKLAEDCFNFLHLLDHLFAAVLIKQLRSTEICVILVIRNQ